MRKYRSLHDARLAERFAELQSQECDRRAARHEEEARVLEREGRLLLEKAAEHREQAEQHRRRSLKWEDRRAEAYDAGAEFGREAGGP